MTENFKGEKDLLNKVQNSVKQHMIKSKFDKEPISFGQAVVTHHYLNNEPPQAIVFHPTQNPVV